MKTGLELCFRKGSLNGKFYIQLFEHFIKFEPYSFTKKYTTKPWDEKKHKKIIANADSEDSLIVDSKNYDLFLTTDTGSKIPHRAVQIAQDSELFLPSNEDVEEITSHQGFVAAYLYDEEYVYVQSTVYSNNMEGRDISMDSIKDTPYRINEFRKKEYDIRYNPGRKDLISNVWLMAAWKMWFGTPFFELVSKERLLSFPDAIDIKELPNGQIYVKLFERMEESATNDNMDRQRNWRNWLNFDELIKKYSW